MTSRFRNKLSEDLFLTLAEVSELILTAPERYKVFTIAKKSSKNKRRTICQPSKELKLIQRYVAKTYLQKFNIHSSATAYLTGCSAYKNSCLHSKNSYINKYDFKDFFNSISKSDFILFMKSFCKFDLTPNDIEDLSNILFWNDHRNRKYVLAIGAPTSPIVSNILMNNYDKSCFEYCNSHEVTYTRYADDIVISSAKKEALKKCEAYLFNNKSLSGISCLEFNNQKTKRLSKKGKRVVTGFIISNEGKPSLGREKKRLLRSMIYRALHGYKDLEILGYILGMLGHIKSIDLPFLKSLKKTYGEDFIDKIKQLDASKSA